MSENDVYFYNYSREIKIKKSIIHLTALRCDRHETSIRRFMPK